jgi:hypothetical protein
MQGRTAPVALAVHTSLPAVVVAVGKHIAAVVVVGCNRSVVAVVVL